MILELTHSIRYNTDDKELMDEYYGWIDDRKPTMKSLAEFLVDRFINPNFDPDGSTIIDVVEF
jgi:hypothetical protein